MMPVDVYVARQPIYDRQLKVCAYELLYRKSENNRFEGVDDNEATASLLASSVLVMNFNDLIDGKKGFINFSEEFLTDEIAHLVPPQKIVIEILERVHLTNKVLAACRKLKASGYTLALDDFIFDRQTLESGIFDIIDIVKVEFTKTSLRDQLLLIKKYRGKITFLAEKIETKDQLALAQRMGYELFQGFLFSRPTLVNAQDVPILDQNVLQINHELEKADPNFFALAKMVQGDLGLSYKLMRLANTVSYGSKIPIHSIHQALTRIGINHLAKWMNLIMIQNLGNVSNNELIKNAMIRAKMMEQIAWEMNLSKKSNDFFITGLFSSLDNLMNQPMEEVVKPLPLSTDIKAALLGKNNVIRQHLDAVHAFETADWDQFNRYMNRLGIPRNRYMNTYLTALKWQQALPGQHHTPDVLTHQ